jgi:ADP-heptose:LPS heptosyltransferase
MSHATVTFLYHFAFPWVALICLLQFLADRCGIGTRGWFRSIALALVSLGILFVPVGGVALERWVVGFNANFSLLFTGLFACSVWEKSSGRTLFRVRDWRAGWGFGVFSGLLLYPFALGWGQFDPYSLGWGFSTLFVAAGVWGALLIWRQNRFGYLFLFAIAGYHLRLLESRNYWDYLVDPIYWFVSFPALALSLMPRKMDVELQRKVDATVGPWICRILSCIQLFRRKTVPAGPPRKILIILLSEMGSLVLTRAMFDRLKHQYPTASLHALVFARNRDVLDLLGFVPKENILTLDDRSLKSFSMGALRLLVRLRRLKVDVVIDCELFARVSSILSFLSGAAVRVGFHPHKQEGLYRGSFINRPVPFNPYKHISQQFLTLTAAIDSQSVPKGKEKSFEVPSPPPWLQFPREELDRVAQQLERDFPAVADRRLVLVYPGGGALPIRAWPAEHYLEICTSLLGQGYAVGVIGLPADNAAAKLIVSRCGSARLLDLTSYTASIRHLLALFHRASLLIANDGGPGQLAALTPLPTIVFFGPETPMLYGPLSKNHYCFYRSLACSPCLTAYNHRTSPCDGDNQCLKQIMPEQVLKQARQMLASQSDAGAKIPKAMEDDPKHVRLVAVASARETGSYSQTVP